MLFTKLFSFCFLAICILFTQKMMVLIQQIGHIGYIRVNKENTVLLNPIGFIERRPQVGLTNQHIWEIVFCYHRTQQLKRHCEIMVRSNREVSEQSWLSHLSRRVILWQIGKYHCSLRWHISCLWILLCGLMPILSACEEMMRWWHVARMSSSVCCSSPSSLPERERFGDQLLSINVLLNAGVTRDNHQLLSETFYK